MKREAGLPVADLVRLARDPRANVRERHAAFATLVGRFEAMAFTVASAMCEDAESARDACQEAFALAWQKLAGLREPAAFGGWLRRLVRTRCARGRRRPVRGLLEAPAPSCDTAELVVRREARGLVRSAVAALPPREREAVLLFYFFGESLRAVARALGVTEARAGRLVYEGRLHLRSRLPRSITEAYWRSMPGRELAERIRAGTFDELAGEYRFDERPALPVVVRREGDVLASYAGDQRHVLVARRPDTLTAAEFDGEARFRRNRQGRICDFVYYEFGRRLGVARKLDS